MHRSAQEAIEHFWKVQDGRDYTQLVELFHADARLVDPIYGEFQGIDAIRAYMAKMVEVMSGIDTHFELGEIAGGGDTAWAQWEAVSPKGRVTGCTLYRVRDGKISYYRDYMNRPAE